MDYCHLTLFIEMPTLLKSLFAVMIIQNLKVTIPSALTAIMLSLASKDSLASFYLNQLQV